MRDVEKIILVFTERGAYRRKGLISSKVTSFVLRNPVFVLVATLLAASATYTYLGYFLPFIILLIQIILMIFSPRLLLLAGEFQISEKNRRVFLVEITSANKDELRRWASILDLKGRAVKEEVFRYITSFGCEDLDGLIGVLNRNGLDVTKNKVVVKSFDVYQTVYMLAERFELRPPKISILKMGNPNAAATSFLPGDYTVAITAGLFSDLSVDELKAVLSHELSHIKNNDPQIIFLIISLEYMIRMAVVLNMPWVYGLPYTLLSVTLMFYFIKFLEARADLTAAYVLRDREALKKALIHLGYKQLISEKKSRVKRVWRWFKWFDTHPPLSYRINRLSRGIERQSITLKNIFLDSLSDIVNGIVGWRK